MQLVGFIVELRGLLNNVFWIGCSEEGTPLLHQNTEVISGAVFFTAWPEWAVHTSLLEANPDLSFQAQKWNCRDASHGKRKLPVSFGKSEVVTSLIVEQSKAQKLAWLQNTGSETGFLVWSGSQTGLCWVQKRFIAGFRNYGLRNYFWWGVDMTFIWATVETGYEEHVTSFRMQRSSVQNPCVQFPNPTFPVSKDLFQASEPEFLNPTLFSIFTLVGLDLFRARQNMGTRIRRRVPEWKIGFGISLRYATRSGTAIILPPLQACVHVLYEYPFVSAFTTCLWWASISSLLKEHEHRWPVVLRKTAPWKP